MFPQRAHIVRRGYAGIFGDDPTTDNSNLSTSDNNGGNTSTNTGASLASSKVKHTDTTMKMGVAPPSQSAGQYKTYNVINPANYHPTYPQLIGGAAIDRKHLVTIQK